MMSQRKIKIGGFGDSSCSAASVDPVAELGRKIVLQGAVLSSCGLWGGMVAVARGLREEVARTAERGAV